MKIDCRHGVPMLVFVLSRPWQGDGNFGDVRGVRGAKQSVGSAGEVLASGNAPPRIVFPVTGKTIRGKIKFTL
jgi:hypothetical protein